ncbi:glucose-1-phosphate cytidylyltransferase [Alphaproteobacteria bacterium]|nr:glucose-1-phosphate cytidylyltransferase [Alphaproteobacteria bacterium]
MKVLILAGGLGTRLSEETDVRPKPMVEIGGMPILWHIMKTYSHYGYNDFVILLGYKGYLIKEYFANYFLHQSDVTIDLSTGQFKVHRNLSEPWTVTLLDTGLSSMTGTRIKKAQPIVGSNPFLLTYGDGVTDVRIDQLIQFHKKHGKLVTMMSAQPDGRFGALDMKGDLVVKFSEKPRGDGGWINAGFFVCEPDVFDYIGGGEDVVFEQSPLRNLSSASQVHAFKHNGFWMPMDTLRDKLKLDTLFNSGKAPWVVWA